MKKLLYLPVSFLLLITVACNKEEIPQNALDKKPSAQAQVSDQQQLLNDLQNIQADKSESSDEVAYVSFTGIMEACVADACCYGLGMAIAELAGAYHPVDIYAAGAIGAGTGSLTYALTGWNFIPANFPDEQPYHDYDQGPYSNSENMYDYAGITHNDILDESLTDFDGFYNEGVLSHPDLEVAMVAAAKKYIDSDGPVVFDKTDFSDIMGILSNENLSYPQKMAALETWGGDAFLCDVYAQYFTVIEEVDNFEDFMEYTVEFESVIIASNISAAYKKALLGSFSVMRHTYGYWEHVAE